MPAKLPWGPVVSLDMNQELAIRAKRVHLPLDQAIDNHVYGFVASSRKCTRPFGWSSCKLPLYGRMKNARDAAAITAVAAQPQIAIDRDSVSRPMTLGLRTISIITAMSGAASTPLTTAAQ